MGRVAGSMGRILKGQDPPQLTASWAGYFSAFEFIEVQPWTFYWSVWVLIACGVIVAVKYRHDPALLALRQSRPRPILCRNSVTRVTAIYRPI